MFTRRTLNAQGRIYKDNHILKCSHKTMTSVAEVKEQLITNAVTLFSQHNVKQDEMFKWIRDAITESAASKPCVRILYNSVHGGYSFSKEFKEFIADKVDTVIQHELRTKTVPYVQPFGKHVLDMYDGLRTHLYAYHVSDLHKILKHVVLIYHYKTQLANFIANAKALDIYLKNPNASCDVETSHFTHVSYLTSQGHVTQWCPKYTRADLEKLQKQAKEGSYKRQIENDLAAAEEAALAVVSRETLDDFLAHYKTIIEVGSRDRDRKTLVTLLSEQGYSQDMSIWEPQYNYKVPIITYIIKRDIRAASPDDPNIIARIEEDFGLVCASGTYASLAIAEVPAGMSWNVAEYDGKEEVYVV